MKLGKKSVKNLVVFLGDLKKTKIHSEINWPLGMYLNLIPKLYCLASKPHKFLIAPFDTLHHLTGAKDA